MDSMVRVPGSVPTVCFYKHGLMANNDDYRLSNETTNKKCNWNEKWHVKEHELILM